MDARERLVAAELRSETLHLFEIGVISIGPMHQSPK